MHSQQIPFLEHGSYVQLHFALFSSILHSLMTVPPNGNNEGRVTGVESNHPFALQFV